MSQEAQIPSEKNFGVVMTIASCLFALWPWLRHGESIRWYFLIVALILLLITFTIPALLRWPNWIWFRFGLILQRIISPLILALIFFGILTPFGILLRSTKKAKSLALHWDKNASTYWIIKSEDPHCREPMKRQF